ncbi:60S ribosomal protein L34 [Planoprotostelium fungivorum]|uniref:60S ribosomal protein L34 n=1 Tax=Planoprotostelium fungivorum TaxID=1890364 RepID=A0A2P6NFL4_9EUKA|nr:60S ribosomal protein L34 [Planoprotostelium fungivorum]
MVDRRVTYRRRHSYKNISNRTHTVKTSGGRIVAHYLKKKGTSPKCADCHVKLAGIPALRPHLYRKVSSQDRSVSRAYGGNRCATCVRERVVRAFLIEEQKIVKRVLKAQAQTQKQ